MGHDVFISHSSRDKAVADAICNALENAGLRCWIAPRDLIAGRPFSGEIIRGIKACRVMVLLFSSHANASPEVLREVQLATTNRLHLINFRIEESRVSDDLAYFLGIPHWLDAINEPMKESHDKLVESVRSLLDLPQKEAPAGAEATTTPPLVPARARKSSTRWILAGTATVAIAGSAFYFSRDHSNGTASQAAPGSSPTAAGQAHPGSPAAPVSAADVAERFAALAGSNAIIADPKTPEQHFRNARLHEVAGNSTAARQAYAAYLAADLEMLDPWLNYSSMLKIQEGRAGALDSMRALAGKSKTVSYQVAVALMEEQERRLAKLTELEKEHPEFGPLPYLLSQEYSDQKRGAPTLDEIRTEREWLEKFRAAHAAGKVVKYFLEKKEAEKWLAEAETRWTKVHSNPATIPNQPVKLSFTGGTSIDGWIVMLTLSDSNTKELFYQVDGQGDYISTGHMPTNNPSTGLPLVGTVFRSPIQGGGDHWFTVKYSDKNNQMHGPYVLRFNLVDEAVKEARHYLEGKTGSWLWLIGGTINFSGLIMAWPGIQKVHYSVNSDAVDRLFTFEPDKPLALFPPDSKELQLEVPAATQFVCVQITYKDGTKSAIERYWPK